ncbi:MAG: hypothetical protein ACTHN8_03185, partial [Angustibacter sp.]
GLRGPVVVAVAALVVMGAGGVGLAALAPYTDPYHRQPLLLVGPFDAVELRIALWALVWLAATVAASVAAVGVRRVSRGRFRVLAVAAPVLVAVGLGAVTVVTLVLLAVQWQLTPTYTRLSVVDAAGRHWVVAESSRGFAPSTSWQLFRGGPFVYEEVPALHREVEGRVTPIADGDFRVRVGADGTPVLRFPVSGGQELALR